MTIDQLTLQVPGLLEADGRRLALQVAQGLSEAGVVVPDRNIQALSLDLTARPGIGVNELARQIVAEVLRRVTQLA